MGLDDLKIKVQESPLSDLFFSKLNISALQEAIRYGVYRDSGFVIDRQSEIELVIIMRSIFTEHAQNRGDIEVVAQVRALNARVLDYCVKSVVEKVKSQSDYVQWATSMPVPIEHSKATSTKGERMLEMWPGF